MNKLRLGLICAVLLMSLVRVAQAQENAPIRLDDTSPAIDVMINLPANTSGVISLALSGAGVSLRDATQTVVFSEYDPRVRALELRIAPNSGMHTLTVERLNGIREGQVVIRALDDLSSLAFPVEFVESSTLMLNQERALQLSPAAPGANLAFSTPANMPFTLTANFAGVQAAGQVTDSQNAIIASWSRGLDGVSFVLDGGAYQMALVGNQVMQEVIAGVRLTPHDAAVHPLLDAPSSALQAASQPSPNANALGMACTATIQASSVNLRSGPGTGYSILAYAYRNQPFYVGGMNRDGSWLVIADQSGISAWINRALVAMQGDCQNLQVFDIPYREAQPAQIVIQPPAFSNSTAFRGSAYHDDDHDDDDHKDHDDD